MSLACSVQPEAWSVDYSYDKVGNRITKDEARGTSVIARTSYDYDNIYQLIQVTSPQSQVTSYDYDEVGNREAVALNNAYAYVVVIHERNIEGEIPIVRKEEIVLRNDFSSWKIINIKKL